MADEQPEQTSTQVFYPRPSDEYRFVTGVAVTAEKMVYLDFAQHNGDGADDALGIVRLVMHPDVAAHLLEKLSGLQGSS
jgi:hypothetical protein